MANDHHSFVHSDQQPGIHEFIGEEQAVLIGQLRLDPEGAGGRIHLVVDRQDCPRGDFVVMLWSQASTTIGCPVAWRLSTRGDVLLREREDHGNGLYGGDHQQSAGVGGVHQVPNIHKAQPDPAIDGRSNVAIGKVQLCRINLGLVHLDSSFILADEGFLRINLLLRHAQAFLVDGLIPLEISLRILKSGLILGELPLRLIELRLVWPRVNFKERIALVDLLPFGVVDLHDLTIDARMHGIGGQRGDGSQAVEENIDITLHALATTTGVMRGAFGPAAAV